MFINQLMRWKKWIVAGLFAVAILSISGCNTMEGAGEDIEEAGEKIQDAAD